MNLNELVRIGQSELGNHGVRLTFACHFLSVCSLISKYSLPKLLRKSSVTTEEDNKIKVDQLISSP